MYIIDCYSDCLFESDFSHLISLFFLISFCVTLYLIFCSSVQANALSFFFFFFLNSNSLSPTLFIVFFGWYQIHGWDSCPSLVRFKLKP